MLTTNAPHGTSVRLITSKNEYTTVLSIYHGSDMVRAQDDWGRKYKVVAKTSPLLAAKSVLLEL